MPNNLQKIGVEAPIADKRMVFLHLVSERAGVATQKGGINLTFIIVIPFQTNPPSRIQSFEHCHSS